MVLRMKIFNIFGFLWKIRVLGGMGSRKTNVEGGGGLKREGRFRQFADLSGGGGGGRKKKNKGVLFLRGWGVDTQMHTM